MARGSWHVEGTEGRRAISRWWTGVSVYGARCDHCLAVVEWPWYSEGEEQDRAAEGRREGGKVQGREGGWDE